TRARPAARESEPHPTRPKAKVNLLVVDDDATKRFALRTILAPLDENIVEASSGADALRQLLRNEFAVVLLDVRMPIMDGFETAQLIRQRPRSELTPIIFVTALDQAETDMGRGYNLGAVDFVFAPVVPAIMRAKVSVFVELYRAQQELRRYRTQLETLVEERTIALTAINRELEAFSYSVSHDLRAPLVSFDGLSQTLLEKYGKELDATATDYLQRMREASERMTSVFDGLQMLFRLTSGEIRREEVDVSAMAAQITDDLRTAYPDRQVDVDIAPGITVSGDQRLVRILTTNLINNAWKFTGGKKPDHRASFRRAATPSKTTGGRFFSALWLTCLVVGLVLLADFAYGMWNGVSEQHHLNQVWTSQAGAMRAAPKTVDPALKRP